MALKRSSALRRRKPLKRRYALAQVTPLRPRSRKTAVLSRTRRELVAALLEERPWCEIQFDGCQGRAVDVDEIKSRARGGSILDESNLQTACRFCNGHKEDQPIDAVRRGVARHSWDRGAA